MPMISSSESAKKSNLYPLPDKEMMGKFFSSSLNMDRRSGVFTNVYPPAMTKIRFNLVKYTHSEEERKIFRVRVPWHVFGARVQFQAGVCLGQAFLFFFNEEPKDMKARPCVAPLNNTWTIGRICYGRSRPWYKSRIDKYMKDLHRNFWMGKFNSDLAPSYSSLPDEIREHMEEIGGCDVEAMVQKDFSLNLYKAWEKVSRNGRDIYWKQTNVYNSKISTLEQAVENAVGRYY